MSLVPITWRRGPRGTLMGMGTFDQVVVPRVRYPATSGLGAYGDVPAQPVSSIGVDFPAVSIPADVQIVKIADGSSGTEDTLKIMKKLVLSPWGARNPQIVQLANAIRDGVPSKDYVSEADAIFRWVKNNIAYKLDPAGLEWLQTPLYTTRRRAGDCDDHSILISALAMASGHQAAFRTVKGDAQAPDRFSHVYAVIGVTKAGQTTWLPADTTQRESTLGWDPPDHFGGAVTWVIESDGTEDDSWVS